MSTKYGSQTSRLLDDDVALTDHGQQRFRQRTPEDCSIDPHTAWRLGEWVKHPQVAQSDGQNEGPDDVRVYVHGHEWGVAFLVSEAEQAHIAGHCPFIVVTVVDLDGFDHGPSRAYLHSHGPHGGDGDE